MNTCLTTCYISAAFYCAKSQKMPFDRALRVSATSPSWLPALLIAYHMTSKQTSAEEAAALQSKVTQLCWTDGLCTDVSEELLAFMFGKNM